MGWLAFHIKRTSKASSLPNIAAGFHGGQQYLDIALTGGGLPAPTKVQGSSVVVNTTATKVSASPPSAKHARFQLLRRLWPSFRRRIKSNVLSKDKIPNTRSSKPQVGAFIVHNTPQEYPAEITSTKQEIFHILHVLFLNENGGVHALKKKTLVELEDEVANNLKLLHLANNPKQLYMAEEYLKNIVEPFKIILHLKGSLVEARNRDANNLELTRNLLEGLMTKEFLCRFEQHKEMQNGLETRILKVHKKLRSVKAWRKNLKKAFGMAYLAAAISSCVLYVMGLTIEASAITAGSNALSFIEKLVDSLLDGWEEAFKGERKIITKILDFHVIVKKLVDDIVLSMTNMEVIANVVVKETKIDLNESSNIFENLGNLVDLCTVEMTNAMAESLKIIVAEDV